MAEPARDSAAAQDPPDTANKHDPRARGWADVQRGLIIGVEAWRRAVEKLVRDPAGKEALEMVRLTGGVVESLGEIGRRWVVDDEILADVERRAYAAGYAACKAERCRLQVVDGG
jgi:hypothetical protein